MKGQLALEIDDWDGQVTGPGWWVLRRWPGEPWRAVRVHVSRKDAKADLCFGALNAWASAIVHATAGKPPRLYAYCSATATTMEAK